MTDDTGRLREFGKLAVGYGGAAAAIVLLLYVAQRVLVPEGAAVSGEVTEVAATITDFSGRVEAKRATGVAWIPAEKDLPLGERDRVRTGDGSHSVIRFTGGTELRIGENSLIVISESSVELDEGSVEAGSAGTEGSKMKIKTAGGTEIELVKREIDIF